MYDIDRRTAKKLKEKFALANKRNASSTWCEDVLTNKEENIKKIEGEVNE